MRLPSEIALGNVKSDHTGAAPVERRSLLAAPILTTDNVVPALAYIKSPTAKDAIPVPPLLTANGNVRFRRFDCSMPAMKNAGSSTNSLSIPDGPCGPNSPCKPCCPCKPCSPSIPSIPSNPGEPCVPWTIE